MEKLIKQKKRWKIHTAKCGEKRSKEKKTSDSKQQKRENMILFKTSSKCEINTQRERERVSQGKMKTKQKKKIARALN